MQDGAGRKKVLADMEELVNGNGKTPPERENSLRRLLVTHFSISFLLSIILHVSVITKCDSYLKK